MEDVQLQEKGKTVLKYHTSTASDAVVVNARFSAVQKVTDQVSLQKRADAIVPDLLLQAIIYKY